MLMQTRSKITGFQTSLRVKHARAIALKSRIWFIKCLCIYMQINYTTNGNTGCKTAKQTAPAGCKSSGVG